MFKRYIVLIGYFYSLFSSESNPAHVPPLLRLPQELHTKIYSELSDCEYINLLFTNKYLAKLAKIELKKIIEKTIRFNSFYLRTLFRYHLDHGNEIKKVNGPFLEKILKEHVFKKLSPLVGNSKFYRKCLKQTLDYRNEVKTCRVSKKLQAYCSLLHIKYPEITQVSEDIVIFKFNNESIIDVNAPDCLKTLKKIFKNKKEILPQKINLIFGKKYNFQYINSHLNGLKKYSTFKCISSIDLCNCKEFVQIKNFDILAFNKSLIVKIKKEHMNSLIKEEKQNSLSQHQKNFLTYVRDSSGFSIEAYKSQLVSAACIDYSSSINKKYMKQHKNYLSIALEKFHEPNISVVPYKNRYQKTHINPLKSFLDHTFFTYNSSEKGHIKHCKKLIDLIGTKLIVPYFLELKDNKDEILEEITEQGFEGIIPILEKKVKKSYKKYHRNTEKKLTNYIVRNSFVEEHSKSGQNN